jgi:hypothetical protein
VISAPATAASFVDIQRHWARPFIEALAQENLINGFSDQTFRPDQPVTRAQFAAMIQQAFDENNVQLSGDFDQAATDYWTSRDFGSTRSSNRQLRLSDPLPRAQVLVALVNGLRLSPRGSVENTLNVYKDAAKIPSYAREAVAAATQEGLVVNYPDVTSLDPTKSATRADVAAFIYQTLVNQGALSPISSRAQAYNYIVRVNSSNNRYSTQSARNNNTQTGNIQTGQYRVARGTSITVQYPQSDRISVAPGETRNLILVVAQDIKNSRGEIVIPKNSEIEGQIVPRYSGSSFLGAQFVGQRLIIDDESYNDINITSPLITAQQAQAPKPRSIGEAAINVLTGVLTGRSSNTTNQQDQAIVIDPTTDLQLTVGSDFYVNNVTSTSTQTQPIR